MIGKILNDRYKIVELIGRGGMAIVYKAVDLKLNREVAVKVLREEYTENEQFIRKFDRESQAAAGLSHPNIVSVYDVGVQDNIYYIIMEYVKGITLKQYLNEKGVLDYEEATQYILEVASALKCAHEHKIIHRDIKPHNILLTEDLTPKVADFGIARAATSSTVTVTNQTMGSVHYISPEQARGGFVDECSDLYSLGIMYYELLTGQLPYDAESSVSIAIKHIQEPINPPINLNSNIPNSVNEIVLKLTQKKPEDRYQNAQELIEDLDVLLDDFENTLPNSPVQTGPIDTFGADFFVLEDEDSDKADSTGEAAHKNKKDLRKWIIIGAGLLVLLIAIGLFAANGVFNRQVVVPDVNNLPLEEATQTIENAGLEAEVERETYNADVPVGNVISQNPSNGSYVREGSKVKLTISQGVETIAVPDVIGMSEEEANSTLMGLGFNVEIQREFNADYENGIVFQCDPQVGTKLMTGESVILIVSKGEDTVTVPGIIGLTQSDAENRLSSNGLATGNVNIQSSSSYAAGIVISQNPNEGAHVQRGTYVSFTVSSGPPTSNDSSNKNDGSGNGNSNNNSSNSGSNSNNNSGSGSGSNSGTGSNSSGSGNNQNNNESGDDNNENTNNSNNGSNNASDFRND